MKNVVFQKKFVGIVAKLGMEWRQGIVPEASSPRGHWTAGPHADATARDAPGTVLRQHRKSFVPNIATLPICHDVGQILARE